MSRQLISGLVVLTAFGFLVSSANAQRPQYRTPQVQQTAVTNGDAVNRPASVAAPKGYPQLNAALYPSPIQNVPYQVGGTLITNQAFAPHEMLYPHTYKALYPPFYYKVRGGWILTPWGVESHSRWELQGTEVKVEYLHRSRGFFSRILRR